MSFTTMFLQQCPTCGRRLEIQVRHLGKGVQCPHCRCTFVANNVVADPRPKQADLIDQALRDAEIYLASVDEINEVGKAWKRQRPTTEQPFT